MLFDSKEEFLTIGVTFVFQLHSNMNMLSCQFDIFYPFKRL